MTGVTGSEARELLEWELSLDSRDIRAHAWYHGAINRQRAESLLVNNGDFLVRDCSSSGRPGDFVLSCRWEDANLHFLIHKEVTQKDTIYEALRYRFESESFDTVPDLITYHVGGNLAISASSGAVISHPKNRTAPLCHPRPRNLILDGVRSDYASLCRSEPVSAVSVVERISTLERQKQKSLNLNPPAGLLEELEYIPPKLATYLSNHVNGNGVKNGGQSEGFNLECFQSILLPSDEKCIKLDGDFVKTVCSTLLEASERTIALHVTKLDYDILSGNIEQNFEKSINGHAADEKHVNGEVRMRCLDSLKTANIYDKLLSDSQHRWNNVIERSLSFSHFVTAIILKSEQPEQMINKWICIAEELKSSLGNFFSFCSIMRGLLRPQITRSDGKINWLRLRQEHTCSAFSFETTMRGAYQGVIRGTDSYPPNTTIPELFTTAVILEDCLEIVPLSCITAEDDQLELYCRHLREIRTLSTWSDIQKRNLERQIGDNLVDDMILQDIFRTELHLLFLWGDEYPMKSLKDRCAQVDNF